jgi:hypothetical protein
MQPAINLGLFVLCKKSGGEQMVNPSRTTLLCTPKDRLHATQRPSSRGKGRATGRGEPGASPTGRARGRIQTDIKLRNLKIIDSILS